MKHLIAVFFLAALAACGGSETETDATTTDTAAAGTTQPATSADAGSRSMMQVMQENMDQMKAVPSTGNPDNDFAALMKIHHMGALQMAEAEVARGSDDELRKMAQRMVEEQQREIAELNSFLSGHEAHGGGDAFYKEVMGNMKMDMSMDHSASVDQQFVEMMIPHHQGAIDMAKSYLKHGAHEPKLKEIANMIITDQQREISEMKAWLAKHKRG